jgi:hypothetical protein
MSTLNVPASTKAISNYTVIITRQQSKTETEEQFSQNLEEV